MAAAPLALTSGQGADRSRSALQVAVVLVDAAGLMLFAGLVGAFLHVRHVGGEAFPPEGVTVDRYLGNLVMITMLMGSATVEWARAAVVRADRRQGMAGFGVTLGLALAVINLLWYGANRAHFAAAATAYGILASALVLTLALSIAAAAAFVLFTLFRVAGGQVTAAQPEQARAAAWFWHFAVVASLAVWYAVVVLR
jgi:heme/copper-type cytochrome/quinol oxidase subunit 3